MVVTLVTVYLDLALRAGREGRGICSHHDGCDGCDGVSRPTYLRKRRYLSRPAGQGAERR